MKVSEIMHKGVNTVQIYDSIKKVATLMKNEDIGCAPVFKNERPVGFVTDRDIVISGVAGSISADKPISHAMSHDIYIIHESDDIELASKIMRDHKISRLLVMNKGEEPVGILALHDIVKNLSDEKFKTVLLNEIKS